MPLYQQEDIILNGKYKIEKLLGAGAFGEVYLATHVDLGVQRAIKVAHRSMPGFASSRFEEAFDRFRQEAQIGARIKNDHIIQIYDFENGVESLHLVMEYASGGSLEEKLINMQTEEKAFLVDDSLRLIHDLAFGLAVLHDKRNPIVHRDLKPSNILFDAEGQAKIADLGLAQVQGGLSQRTRLGSLAQPHPGTPAYMSPEQESSYIMLRSTSDIYSVGVMWFEMLSGVNYKMQSPGTKIGDFRDDLPDDMSKLLEDMLVKDADQRLWDGKRLLERIEILISQNEHIHQHAHQTGTATKQPGYSEKALFEQEVYKNSSPRKEKQKETSNKDQISPRERPIQDTQMPIAYSRSQQNGKLRDESGKVKQEGSKIIDLVDGVQMEFVHVPAGEFWMGADENEVGAGADEKPKHKVYLDDYWIGKFPVTNREYACFIKETGHKSPEHWKNELIPQHKENHPVIYVSWYDAEAFTKWISTICGIEIKLPSEAQWEKAARGADGRKYPWGNEFPYSNLGNFFNKNQSETTFVGSFLNAVSPYGVLDMAGNVREWMRDWYDAEYYEKSQMKNPQGPISGDFRVMRSGSIDSLVRCERSSVRSYNDPVCGLFNTGFRCTLII